MFNSSLSNISKKRQSEIDSGTFVQKKRKPLKQMSDKMKKRVKSYRELAFGVYGHRCELCCAELPENQLEIHHITGRSNGDAIHNLAVLCHKCHNHKAKDARFYEIQKQILRKRGKI